MNVLTHIDLSLDPEAKRFVKNEIVTVCFPKTDGDVMSREGVNRYRAGDALITGSTGDRWSVTRDRFDAKYDAIPPLRHGEDGAYRNRPIPVFAKQIPTAFSIARTNGGDLISGNAGDWLMQYAPGDHGIVEEAKFRKVYRLLAD